MPPTPRIRSPRLRTSTVAACPAHDHVWWQRRDGCQPHHGHRVRRQPQRRRTINPAGLLNRQPKAPDDGSAAAAVAASKDATVLTHDADDLPTEERLPWHGVGINASCARSSASSRTGFVSQMQLPRLTSSSTVYRTTYKYTGPARSPKPAIRRDRTSPPTRSCPPRSSSPTTSVATRSRGARRTSPSRRLASTWGTRRSRSRSMSTDTCFSATCRPWSEAG